MELQKLNSYNSRQESLLKRKKEKEFYSKRELSEKLRMQEERERKLKETKQRFESQTENFKMELSEKLNKVHDRVN